MHKARLNLKTAISSNHKFTWKRRLKSKAINADYT